jgi:prevent-host-death family protein
MFMSITEPLNITEARKQLATIIDQARTEHEPVYLTRRGHRVAAVIDADDLDGILALAEDMADIRAAEDARAEMRATGEAPIPWEQVKVDLCLVRPTRLFSRRRQPASFANLIRLFVDESKRSSSYLPRIPGPQLQRASLVVRASGRFGRPTTGYSGEFGQLFRSFRTPRGAVGGRVATDVCVSG